DVSEGAWRRQRRQGRRRGPDACVLKIIVERQRGQRRCGGFRGIGAFTDTIECGDNEVIGCAAGKTGVVDDGGGGGGKEGVGSATVSRDFDVVTGRTEGSVPSQPHLEVLSDCGESGGSSRRDGGGCCVGFV